MEAIADLGIPPVILLGATVAVAGGLGFFIINNNAEPTPEPIEIELSASKKGKNKAAKKQDKPKKEPKKKKKKKAKVELQPEEEVATKEEEPALEPVKKAAPEKAEAAVKPTKMTKAQKRAAKKARDAEAAKAAAAAAEAAKPKKTKAVEKPSVSSIWEETVSAGDDTGDWTMVVKPNTDKPKKNKQQAPIKDEGATILQLGSSKAAVIGKKGSMIQEITAKSGATIDISKTAPQCTITGSASQIAAATKLIEAVKAKSSGSNSAAGGSKDSVEVGDRISTVIGKGGKNVKMITQDSGARIDISKDNNPKGTVNIIGTPEQIHKAKALIADLLKSETGKTENKDSTKVAVIVGAANIRTVIGAKGSMIHKIEAETGARLDISKEGNTEGRVNVSGSAEQVAQAKAMIEAVCKPKVHECTEEMDLEKDSVGLVIGNGGKTIRRLMEESGADINVSRDGECKCTISGSVEAVAQAKELIAKCLTSRSTKGPAAGEAQEVLDVGEFSKQLIGRSGSTINEIQDSTGASLNVSRDENPRVTITGTKEAVAEAKARVEQILANARSANVVPEGHVKISIEVPDFVVGSIIGRGGANIKELQASTGARVDIKRGSGRADVSGSEEAVAKAKEQIEATIESQREREEEEAGGEEGGDEQDDWADGAQVEDEGGW